MESGNTVSFTGNITVVHQWQDSLCLDTRNHTTGERSIPGGLSIVETYTLLAVTKHGIQSNKTLTLGSNLATGWGRKLQRSCGVWE